MSKAKPSKPPRKQYKIAKLDIKRRSGFMYYIDAKGNVMEAPMRGKTGSKVKLGTIADFVREKGWLYFIDADGDLARCSSGR